MSDERTRTPINPETDPDPRAVRPPGRRYRRDRLLGTAVEITVVGSETATEADQAANACLEEIERTQRIFDVFDDQSELRRWQRGEASAGEDLATVAALSAQWTRRSGGTFDPSVAVLMDLWDVALSKQVAPSPADIAEALARMGSGEHRSWNFNAIAKGWIVDRAVRRVLAKGDATGLIVNAGGDLLARGAGSVNAGIQDPRRPYDNEPPLTRVALCDCALATSGGTRRGWSIDGEWYGHVIDPRTGWPVGHVESASVIAPTAVTADVVATILTVLPIDAGLAFADDVGVACLVLGADGRSHRSDGWRDAEADVIANRKLPLRPPSGSVHTLSSQNLRTNPAKQENRHAF